MKTKTTRLTAIAAIIPSLSHRAARLPYHPSRWEDGNPARIRADFREAQSLGSKAIVGTPADRLLLIKQLPVSLRGAVKIWGVQLRPARRLNTLP